MFAVELPLVELDRCFAEVIVMSLIIINVDLSIIVVIIIVDIIMSFIIIFIIVIISIIAVIIIEISRVISAAELLSVGLNCCFAEISTVISQSSSSSELSSSWPTSQS